MKPILLLASALICSACTSTKLAPTPETQITSKPLQSQQYKASGDKQMVSFDKAYQQKALEIYRKVIAYRTAAGHGQVPLMAKYLADQFIQGGFEEKDVNVLPFKANNGEDIAGLVVRYRGNGSANKKPILLVAHMDIVDALPKDWERDPFTLIEENGFFFGRGALDNKAGVTALTTTFLRLKAEGFVPTRDLIIAFTGDEESGMQSTELLVTKHRDLTDAEFALNADDGGGYLDSENNPTSYRISTSEKTYASYDMTIRNPGGHSSTPRIDNAIYELADALKKLQKHSFPVRFNDATLALFSASAETEKGLLSEALSVFSKDPTNQKAIDYLSTNASYASLIRTTCVATMLYAGHAENALAQSASATVNCRIFPGIEPEKIQSTLQSVVGENVEIKMLGNPTSSPASMLREDVTQAVTKAVHTLVPNVAIMPAMVQWGTDGKILRANGIPTYGISGVFIRDEDDFAHGLNERIPVNAFYAELEHWYIVLHELAGED
jgi:acetylornithine deacetylase/succinyl-diaminopimelate desuccinylase-like protein